MASKRRLRRQKCTSKVRHKEAEARKQADFMRRKFAEDRYEAYLCDLCSGWHIGHRPTPPGQKRKRRADFVGLT